MNKIKIIFLVDSNFSDRDYERFGINKMISMGVDVCLWDFRKHQNLALNLDRFDLESQEIDNLKCNTELKVNEIKGAFVIDHRSQIYKKYSRYWFKENGAYIIEIDLAPRPNSHWKPSIADLFLFKLERFSHYNFNNFLKKITIKLVSNINQCDYDVKICGGTSKCSGKGLCVEAHSFDYDTFLRIGGASKMKGYLLFVDNGMVEHPDFIKLHLKPYCTHESYYPAMNNFFDIIEENTGLRVLIASHPSLLNIQQLSKFYGGRKVISGNTAELVRDANLILAHDSTAISFAVLWEKPLLILTTNQLQRRIYSNIKSLCALLYVKAINVDNFDDKLDWLYESTKAINNYSNYKELLIKKSGTQEKDIWTIFIDQIRENSSRFSSFNQY